MTVNLITIRMRELKPCVNDPPGPPPPYSAHGGPPQGHRKGAGAKGGRYNNLEMRKVCSKQREHHARVLSKHCQFFTNHADL
uniref:Uncharacterized protein n=1 Tax=Magallana gigas TaxID=29159 RepID=K1P0W6_MAGGI